MAETGSGEHTNLSLHQKDSNISIEKHEKSRCGNGSDMKSPDRKGFTYDDVLLICKDIVRSQNIKLVEQEAEKKESGISHKLKSVKNYLTSIGTKEGEMEDKQKHADEAIPGLQGRDVVAVAILVGKDGQPTRSYTENDDIPSDDMESAGNVILTHLPVDKVKESDEAAAGEDVSAQALVDVLAPDLESDVQKKLIKRMEKVLLKLHTTDINTARSFLKLDRFSNVRSNIKSELVTFFTKDMNLTVAHD